MKVSQQGLENSRSRASVLGPTPILAPIGLMLLLGRFETPEIHASWMMVEV